jgi:hypothetical protein
MGIMDDLVIWLRAQLDEEEATAWPHRPGCPMLRPAPDDLPDSVYPCTCDAAARWLRELAAKRRMIDWYVELDVDPQRLSDPPTQLTWNVLAAVVRTIAAVYSDRPGYRAEWAP